MPFAVGDSMANGKEFRIGFRLNSEAGNERTTDRLARRQRSTLGLHSRRVGVGAGGAGGGLKRTEIAKTQQLANTKKGRMVFCLFFRTNKITLFIYLQVMHLRGLVGSNYVRVLHRDT